MQFSGIIALQSCWKIATRLHGALANFAERKIAQIQSAEAMEFFIRSFERSGRNR